MVNKPTCIYCGARVYKEVHICPNCQEKLKLIRRIIAIGVEIRLQAGKERVKT